MSRFTADHFSRIGTVAPTARFAVADVVKDCTELGLMDELRSMLDIAPSAGGGDTARAVRDLVYELAGAKNRELAVDVLIHATGLAEFECRSLRDYARKHGMTAEGFRRHVSAMQQRLGLPGRQANEN